MGIYPSGIIYGIRIYVLVNGDAVELFQRKYDKAMSYENKKEVKLFYKGLSETNKQDLRFQIYTECSSPYEDDFMLWYPISLGLFKEKFYC